MWIECAEPQFRTNKLGALCILGCLILIIASWLVAALSCAISDKHAKKSNDSRSSALKEAPFLWNEEARSFLEAKEFCRRFNKDLPHPRNQREENEVVRDIEEFVAEKCRFVYFGLVANVRARYQSTISDAIMPSLKFVPNDTIPFNFTQCYIVKLFNKRKPVVVSRRKCANDTTKNLLFLTHNGGELCHLHRFKCVEIYRSRPSDTVLASVSKAKNENPNLSWLVPYDKVYHPLNLEMHTPVPPGLTVTLATRYIFRYEFENIGQRYKSNRFLVIDPEHDCLAYDTRTNKLITRSCEDSGCTVCL